MRRAVLLVLFSSLLAGSGIVGTMSTVRAADPSQTTETTVACPDGNVCMYSGTNYTGTMTPAEETGRCTNQTNFKSVKNKRYTATVHIYNQRNDCKGPSTQVPPWQENPDVSPASYYISSRSTRR